MNLKQPFFARRLSTMLGLCLMLCSACSKQQPANDAKAESKAETAALVVVLKPEEVSSLGVATNAATAVRYLPVKSGFGVVLSHDVIAQTVAEVATARATARQSQAVLERTQRLSGTPGADSVEVRDNAARQAAVDTAALQLARAKSSSVLGQHPPWVGGEDNKRLADLAEGRAKLVRVTFPLGAINGRAPSSVVFARLDAVSGGERWTAHGVWDAPADAGMPGRSFFALLPNADAGEGERLLAWAAGENSEHAESGILIPSSAIVISGGKYWYYLEQQPGTFVRTPLDIGRPMVDGYFINDKVKPGDLIVTAAAGLLLARETNPSTEAE